MTRAYRSQRHPAAFADACPSVSPIFRLDASLVSGADGAAVSSIADAGGGGLTLTQATGGLRPTIVTTDGRKALRFDRSSGHQMLSATGGITGAGAHTMICCYKQRAGASGYSPICSYGPTNGITSSLGLGFTTSTTVWGGGSGSGAGQPSPTIGGGGVNGWHIISKVYDGSTVKIYYDGAPKIAPFSDTYNVGSAAFGLGTPWTAGALVPDVDVSDAVWVNSALSMSQLRLVHRWMARKNQIGLPVTLLCIGDSITAGTGATSSFYAYPAVLGRSFSRPVNVLNLGVPGKTLEAIAGSASYLADVSARLTLAHFDAVLYWAGTNDISGASKTGTTLQPVAQGYYTQLKTLGATHVLAATMLPRGTDPGFATERGVYNTELRAHPHLYCDYVDALGGYGLIDTDTITGLNDVTSNKFDVDQTHLTDAGYNAVALSGWRQYVLPLL